VGLMVEYVFSMDINDKIYSCYKMDNFKQNIIFNKYELVDNILIINEYEEFRSPDFYEILMWIKK